MNFEDPKYFTAWLHTSLMSLLPTTHSKNQPCSDVGTFVPVLNAVEGKLAGIIPIKYLPLPWILI